MIQISVAHDLDKLTRWLDDVQRKQLPFATARALTRTAQDVQAEVPKLLTSVLDKPKPFTLRSTYIRRADKRTFPIQAEVGFKRKQAAYLAALLKGGSRELKPSETRFRGRPIVPGPAAPMDQYGNVRKTDMIRILRAADNGGRGWKGGTVFVGKGKQGRLPDGIWQMDGRQIRPLFFFADQVQYERTIPFLDASRRVVRDRFPRNFGDAVRGALATAR
jgi:hypothetical protein